MMMLIIVFVLYFQVSFSNRMMLGLHTERRNYTLI